MINYQDIVDLVRMEIVPKINNVLKIKEIILDDIQTITVRLCSVKWLKKDGVFITDLYQFQAVSVDWKTNIVVFARLESGSTLKKNETGTIVEPTFVHGTKIVVNKEWKQALNMDITQGLPLIWLYESINETEFNKDSSKKAESVLRLFFLDYYDPNDSLINELQNPNEDFQIRKQAVRPMLSLCDEFINVINDSYICDISGNSPKTTFSIFGNENSSGVYEKIIEAELGGVELRPTLITYKKVSCC